MTEARWLALGDPTLMVSFLVKDQPADQSRKQAMERKLRLFRNATGIDPGWPIQNESFRRQCIAILHDLFGPLPFRPVAVDPAWLTWNHSTVPAIARHIYEDRAFHDLPILADALEDAGCTDAVILAHCRGGGKHVRGCWVVDLLLGKS